MSRHLQTVNKKSQPSCQLHYQKLALAIALAVSSTIPTTSQAATYTVSNTNNSGTGSLRQAVFDADATTDQDIIQFTIPSGSTINLLTQLFISNPVTISGPTSGDTNSIILDAGGNSRVIDATSLSVGETLTIENMTLTNGYINLNSSRGGGIDARDGNIVLNHSAVTNSKSLNGGGGISLIGHGSNLTLNDSEISGNSTTSTSFGSGGGLWTQYSDTNINNSKITNNFTIGSPAGGGGINSSSGHLTIHDSIVSGNSTFGESSDGGGVSVNNADLKIYGSTISDNFTIGVNSQGGGIDHGYGISIFFNSTLSGNNTLGSNSDGGGLRARQVSFLWLSQATVSGNSTATNDAQGGGLHIQSDSTLISQSTITKNDSPNSSKGIWVNIYSANLFLNNSILAGNGFVGNFDFEQQSSSGTGVLNASHSLFGDSISEISGSNVNSYSTLDDPTINLDLGPLQHNGGTPQTHLPAAGSFVINKGLNQNSAFPQDQRGNYFPRIVNTTVDMGSVEWQPNTNSNPNEVVTRRDLAREILKAMLGLNYKPPLAGGSSFDDVSTGDINADWIEKFSDDDYTEGCSADKYCPNKVVSRESLAKIFLKVRNGTAFMPSSSSNLFTDVPAGSFNAAWINELSDNIFLTIGCDTNKFCPKEPVTREWFNHLLSTLP